MIQRDFLLIYKHVTNILSFSDTELRKVNKIKTILKALSHRKPYAYIYVKGICYISHYN